MAEAAPPILDGAKDGGVETKAGDAGKKPPVCIICIGMAGSGKTTFVQRLNSHLHAQNSPPYILNLDAAVAKLPFTPNIDIRDTVDYKEVMKQYNLGPNGGILTALNLFTTKFDQVLSYVEKRASTVDYVLVDTPGQIEIFTWSASGAIITDALASAMPTIICYIIDTPRTASPTTFMSNMLYACSIMYKTRLPFLLVFNKTDVQHHSFAVEWMRDFEAFQSALADRREQGLDSNEGEGGGYMGSLMNSMSLVLDEFYQNLRAVGCSAMTGAGMKDFFASVEEARKEYEEDYKPELDRRVAERAKVKEEAKADGIARLVRDMKVAGKQRGVAGPSRPVEAEDEDPAALTREEIDAQEAEFEDEETATLDRGDFEAVKGFWTGRGGGPGTVDDGMGGRWPAPR